MSLQEKLQNSGLRYGGLIGLPNLQNSAYANPAAATAMQGHVQALGSMRSSSSSINPVAVTNNSSGSSNWMQGYQSQQMANATGGTGPSAVSNIMNKAGSEVASMVAQDIANAVGKAASEAASAYTNGGAPRLLGSTL